MLERVLNEDLDEASDWTKAALQSLSCFAACARRQSSPRVPAGPNASTADRAAVGPSQKTYKKPANVAGIPKSLKQFRNFGAGEGIRTLDPNLGKVVLYP